MRRCERDGGVGGSATGCGWGLWMSLGGLEQSTSNQSGWEETEQWILK